MNKSMDSRKKPVCQYLIENNQFVAEYDSASSAKKITGLFRISECCLNKRKQCGDKYYFRYKNNYFPYIEKERYFLGKKLSDEHIEKMKMNHPFRKDICQYDIKTNELIAEYKSSHEAEEKTSISRKQITNCCNGKKNYNSAGGYYWRFKDEYFEYVKPSNSKVTIYQYDEKMNLINEYYTSRKLSDSHFELSRIKNSIKNNKLYKNSFWKISC